MKNRVRDASGFDFCCSLKQAGSSRSLLRFVQFDRWINRPLASLFVRAAILAGLRPNHLTVAAFLVSVAGALFYLRGDHRGFIIAGTLIYVSTILDGADGMLARSRGLCTRFGAYLDLYLDRITDYLVFWAIATGYFLQSGRLGFYILSLLGLAAYMLQTLLYYLEREFRRLQTGSGASGEFRGLVFLGIFVFSLANRLDLLIMVLLCIPVLNIIYRFIRFWIIERPAEELPPSI